ncbi:hypothetical protein PSAB6_300114 [Paraburkholderia sabiae]|nr:hypothetical protein PSAB6_300114 [Paraburkholderia sabiae]
MRLMRHSKGHARCREAITMKTGENGFYSREIKTLKNRNEMNELI